MICFASSAWDFGTLNDIGTFIAPPSIKTIGLLLTPILISASKSRDPAVSKEMVLKICLLAI